MSKGKSLITLKGKLQEVEQKNGNSRVYPHELFKREVQKYKNGLVKTHVTLGELDHPDSSPTPEEFKKSLKEIVREGITETFDSIDNLIDLTAAEEENNKTLYNMNLVTAKQVISNHMDVDDLNQIKNQMIERAVRHLFEQITVTTHGAFDPMTQTHYLMISLKLNNQIQ